MSLSLYIHFPFCSNLCGYCDFYKQTYQPDWERRYFAALERELTLAIDEIEPSQRTLETIYIGGGTPSLMHLSHLENLLSALHRCFRFASDLEFSFEINPESINAEKLLELYRLGVNRPIFGLQSFNVRLLKRLNRRHTISDSLRAIYQARATGFVNFGIDLIFGLPRQTSRLLSDDLDQAVDLAPPHISYYQLTVEPNTVLADKIASGQLKLPDNDLMAAMYRGIHQTLSKHGYERYEVSSFARPGFACRHNLRYWEGGDFLGLGPAAHSFIGERRFANVADLGIYLQSLDNRTRPLVADVVGMEARMTEAVMLGLRTARGISRGDFHRRFGMPVERAIDGDMLTLLRDNGLISADGNYVKLTDSGLPVADDIIRRLIK
ncbi:MAG: radical SAM family heme chaperone HemW [candidate division Zixibacteria bacterium]|nr:radical SAM family heme chaperone HemW [candidate division Zixibacteria bacterium]